MDSHTLPPPVKMTVEEMISLVKAVYGANIKFKDFYQEADYTAILEDVDGNRYVIFKPTMTVDKIQVD